MKYELWKGLTFLFRTKFKIIAAAAAVLWLVVLLQTVMTRFYVSQNAFTQAFARNQIVTGTEKSEGKAANDSRNTAEGNRCEEGTIAGKLSEEKMQTIAQDMFRQMGGVEVMASSETGAGGYFLAYGYTRGLTTQKCVNGKKINLNIAMSYDEEENQTRVVMGTPLVNSDF
jgi:hypothetical protein